MHLAVVAKPQLVANCEPDLAAFELGQVEPRDALLVESNVPPDDESLLRLRLLEPFVVVGLNLDQRAEDVLVLVRILVPADENRLPRLASSIIPH